MSEHTPLTEAEREALWSWWNTPSTDPDADGGIDFDDLIPVIDRILAARRSTATADTARKATSASSLQHMPDPYAATADTGHQAGCQEFPTGWLCVSDCTTVWHDKDADTGLRERVEAELRSEDATAALYGVVGTHPDSYGGVTKDEALEHACDLLRRLRAILDATAAPTTDTGARDE